MCKERQNSEKVFKLTKVLYIATLTVTIRLKAIPEDPVHLSLLYTGHLSMERSMRTCFNGISLSLVFEHHIFRMLVEPFIPVN